MSIYKRGSVYWIEVRDPSGDRIRESTGTDDEAKAWLYHDQRKNQINAGQVKPLTWDDATARWMAERADKRSLDRDVSIVRWLEKFWSGRIFATINDSDVREVVEIKRSETTASNANHYLKFIKSLFNKSVDWGWIDASPIRMKNYPTPKGKEIGRAHV